MHRATCLLACVLLMSFASCGDATMESKGFQPATADQQSDEDETREPPVGGNPSVDTTPGSVGAGDLILERDEPTDLPQDEEEPWDDQDVPEPRDPDELRGWIGSPCETEVDCAFDEAICLSDDDGFPNGMCVQACDRLCPDRDGFPTTFCVSSDDVGGGACHSRCDYLAYPGLGCRNGYFCSIEERYGESGTEVGTCVPGGEAGEGLSDCLQWLVENQVPFEPTTYAPRHPSGDTSLTCTVRDPVRLHSPVHGINYRYYYDDPGEFRSMLVSCELARAITETSDLLRDEFNVTEVLHVGTTVCRKISGTNRLSQHALGNAIDYSGFFDDDANWYGIYDHWEHDTADPSTTEGRMLYDFAQRLFEEWIYNVILTPEYNRAHDNHFHVDMTEGSHFLGSHDGTWGPFFGVNASGD